MTSGTKGDLYGLYYRQWNGEDRSPEKPWSKPNFYELFVARRSTIGRNFWGEPTAMSDGIGMAVSLYYDNCQKDEALAKNQLVDYLAGMVKSQQYLADLVEAKGAIEAIEQKLFQAFKLTLRLAKLPHSLMTFRGTRATVTIPLKKKPPRWKKPSKKRQEELSKVPSEWLAYWFGIAPTVQAISDVASIFDVPFDGVPFRKRSAKISTERTDDGVSLRCERSFEISGILRIKNPNTGIIQRSGLTDVIGTMWEVAPWSWAVDYFTNVGQMLSNMSGLFDNVEFINDRMTTRTRSSYSLYNARFDRWYSGEGYSQSRGNIPLQYEWVTKFSLSIKRVSYLMSAIALTLKGKL